LPVFQEVAGEHVFYFTGDTPEDLAAAAEAWLVLEKEGKVPQSMGMEWLTWKVETMRRRDWTRNAVGCLV